MSSVVNLCTSGLKSKTHNPVKSSKYVVNVVRRKTAIVMLETKSIIDLPMLHITVKGDKKLILTFIIDSELCMFPLYFVGKQKGKNVYFLFTSNDVQNVYCGSYKLYIREDACNESFLERG